MNFGTKKEITILWNSNIIFSKGFYHLTEALLNIYKNGLEILNFKYLEELSLKKIQI